jgi:hypothetical protein
MPKKGELAMGFTQDFTAPPGVFKATRRELRGQIMEVNMLINVAAGRLPDWGTQLGSNVARKGNLDLARSSDNREKSGRWRRPPLFLQQLKGE